MGVVAKRKRARVGQSECTKNEVSLGRIFLHGAS